MMAKHSLDINRSALDSKYPELGKTMHEWNYKVQQQVPRGLVIRASKVENH